MFPQFYTNNIAIGLPMGLLWLYTSGVIGKFWL
jgi:hypothetical protein